MIALTDINWNNLFQEDIIVPLALFGLMGVALVVVLITQTWRAVATHRADVELKRDMVARGMSVQEIERVLAARPPRK